MIPTVGGERDGQQGGRRETTTSEIAWSVFDVVVAGRVPLVVWPVLTEVVGWTDVIEDGVTGLRTPRRDVGAVVAAWLRYVEDPTLRRQHGRAAARERVERTFHQEQIWDAPHDEYQWLMRGKA
jgi:glycosyltransferase involved in cell wall biosynthesis